MFKKSIIITVFTVSSLFLFLLFPASINAQSTLASTAAGFDQIDAQPGCNGAFLENNGLVIMEVESADLAGSWSLRTDLAGSTGNGYYEWKYGDTSNTIDGAGQGILTYSMQISLK